MPIIKTLVKATKLEKEKFTIPKSVQDAIPIQRIWPDGIFQVGSRFSKTFSFTDINYQIAGKEDKTAMFLDYSELLNALDSGASAKITINNRKINKAEFEKSLLLPMKEDGLNHFRKEYNEMLLSKVTGTNNSVVQDRYITITVAKRNIDEARTYFSRVGTDLITHLSQLSSIGRELDAGTRLQVFRDFFKGNEPAAFAFDLKEQMKKGHNFKDWLCPDSMEFQKDHFRLNDRWGRVLYLQGYASYIKDSMIAELCDMDRSLMLSIDILPVPTDEAVREIQNKLLGVETNAANWQRKQNAANNFSAVLPYDMEQQRKETKEMLDDLTNRDQRMMFGLVTMVHLADTKEQLDSDTETILTTARKHLCQMSVLRWQQKDGLDTVLPYGLRRIQAIRNLTTESTAVLIPFRAQEIMQTGGIYYGQNAVSKNMIVADRRKLLNGNSFRLGVSGSGKSFSAKEEIVSIALSTNDDILILDPESEFGFLVEALGGEIIRISAASNTHLNALDMDKAYGDERNPLIEKSEFILSLFEQLVGAGGVSAKEKSILDRCTYDVYREYMANNYEGAAPTLKDLYHSLLKQPEPEAARIAAALELYVSGSLNVFNHRTNVELSNRLVCFDIKQLGKQLKKLGMLIVQDQIWNRVTINRAEKKSTRYYMDEFHLLLKEEQTAAYSVEIWKRFRKWGGIPTAITQNIKDLLASREVENIFENSDFVLMLNQAQGDRAILAKQLNISPQQMKYVTHTEAGEGLIFYGNVVLPFVDHFPKDTELYRIMTTKPEEVSSL